MRTATQLEHGVGLGYSNELRPGYDVTAQRDARKSAAFRMYKPLQANQNMFTSRPTKKLHLLLCLGVVCDEPEGWCRI